MDKMREFPEEEGRDPARDKNPNLPEITGDHVRGDKFTVGDISGSTGVAIGRGAQTTVNQGPAGDQIHILFAPIHESIARRPIDPDLEKEELTEIVQKLETETAKGSAANTVKVERWLKTLAVMAPDIFEVAVATLSSPAAGLAAVIRKVAEKVRAETG